MRPEIQSDATGTRIVLHLSEEERAEGISGALSEAMHWKPRLLERVRNLPSLAAIGQLQTALAETRAELEGLRQTEQQLLGERRRCLEQGTAFAAVEKKLTAATANAGVVSSRARELEQIVEQRTLLAIAEIDECAEDLIAETGAEYQQSMAEILGAIEAQKGLFLRLLWLRTMGHQRGLHLHSFRDRLRNGSGPQLIQEFLSVSAAAAEVAG
jgi:hypothetical protein